MKKFIFIIIVLLTLFSSTIVQANSNIKVLVNGNEIIFDQPPTIIEDRVYVPIRYIAENLGWEVKYDPNFPDTTALIKKDANDEVLLEMAAFITGDNNSHSVYEDYSAKDTNTLFDVFYEKSALLFPVQTISDRKLISIRDIGKILSIDVEWEDKTRTVSLSSKDYVYRYDNSKLIESKSKIVADTKEKVENELAEKLAKEEELKNKIYTEAEINNYRYKIISLVNEERKKAGLEELIINEILMETAQWHSKEQSELDYFDHTSKTLGLAHTELAKYFGYDGYSAGENSLISFIYDPENAVERWMDSEPHKKHILNPILTEIGVGFYGTPTKNNCSLFIGN